MIKKQDFIDGYATLKELKLAEPIGVVLAAALVVALCFGEWELFLTLLVTAIAAGPVINWIRRTFS